jgi:arylamine N-acetyltransferase
MGGAPGEGVTLDGSVGAVGDEFPPQATYPRASRSKNTIEKSFFISDLLFGHFLSAPWRLSCSENEQAGCHRRARLFIGS